MASVFGHAVLAGSLASFWNVPNKACLITLGVISSILPDADIIAFKFGIPYSHMFGHRGITHSLFFALVWSLILSKIFFGKSKSKTGVALYLFLCTATHGVLDAMTTGGRGIAFFAPFSSERFFLPWRVIKVSPIHAEDFFGEWGIQVLRSELYWVGIPCVAIIFLAYFFKSNQLLK